MGIEMETSRASSRAWPRGASPGSSPFAHPGSRWWLPTLAVLGAVWMVTRVASLRLSLWWDEAFTAQQYVRGGRATLLDPDAYVANNHVLFSALTWASTRFTGTSEPWLRLWAIGPATVATVAIVWWLWHRSGPAVAVLTTALMVTSTLWLAMSTQARGYGLVVLASTVMLMVVVHEDRDPTWRGEALVAASGLVAMATFPPTVALYLAHTGVWLVRRRSARLRLVVITATVGFATALVYLPLVDLLFERADRVGSRFADPISWWSPVMAPLQIVGGASFGVGSGLGPVSSAGATVAVGSRTVELGVGSVPGLLALVVGVVGIVVVLARLDRPLGIHLLAGLGGSIVLLAPAGFHLADRYISFLLPHATLAMAFGLAAMCGAFASRERPWTPVAVIAVAVGLVAATVPVVWQAATTPLQAFAEASAVIRAEPDATILVDSYHTGYRWYLDDLEVERVTEQSALDERLCDPDGVVFFARHPDQPLLEVPSCLSAVDERRFEHQRAPGHLSLWIVGSAADAS